jgi:carboxypeptidase T
MTKKGFPLLPALVVIVIVLSLGVPGSWADTPAAQPGDTLVVRLYFHDRVHLDQVAGKLDIWEVHYDLGYAVAAVQPAQYEWLQTLDYRVEIDAEKTALMGIEAPLDPRYHYFDDFYTNPNGLYMVDFMQDVTAAYPTLTELFNIGEAWLAGQPGEHGRDIWVLRITNEDPAYGAIDEKPAFYLFGGIHAREVAIPELLIRYVTYLTDGYDGEGGYDVDPDVTWLVNHNVIYVHLSQNPDGHWVNEQDINAYRRKNMDDDDGCNVSSSWGVDLNRNHSFFWGCCGGSSGEPCDELYRGPSAGSEPETQAFQNYFNLVIEDQNGPNDNNTIAPASPLTTTGIFLSMHSYSDLVIWPWGFSSTDAPNGAQLRTIGRKLGYYTGYDPSGDIYVVDGATDDWTYGRYGIASFTFEVGSSWGSCGGFFPAYGCIDGIDGMSRSFWDENRPAFLYIHKIARTPYMTAYGPDTEEVTVTPDSVPQGSPVALTATIADHRYASDPLQPIYGAEYFFDAPGGDGTGIALAPGDGSWGDLVEGVEGQVDTSSLAPGKHYVLVHGLNDDGDWGPFTAAFITTTTGIVPETMELEVSPASIPIVHGQASVTATLTLSDGTPTPGWMVTFTTDLGSLDPTEARTGASGQAVVTLYAGPITGTAHVSAQGVGLAAGPEPVEFVVPEAPLAGFLAGDPVCAGTPLVFTNTTTTPPMAPASYGWVFGDGAGTSTDTHPTYTYASGGDYVVSLTATNAGGTNTISHTVTITPTPASFFTFTPAFPQPGDPIQFHDASSHDPSAWTWDFDDGGTATIQNPIHTYWNTGTYTVTLQARNNCGWGAASQQAITIGAVPKFTIYLPIIVRER